MNTFHGDNRISHQPSDIFEFALQNGLYATQALTYSWKMTGNHWNCGQNFLEINPKWRDTSTVGWMCWQLLFQDAPEYLRSCNPRGRNQEGVLAFHNTQILFRSKFSPGEKTRELYDWPTFPQVARRNNPTYRMQQIEVSKSFLTDNQRTLSIFHPRNFMSLAATDRQPAIHFGCVCLCVPG